MDEDDDLRQVPNPTDHLVRISDSVSERRSMFFASAFMQSMKEDIETYGRHMDCASCKRVD